MVDACQSEGTAQRGAEEKGLRRAQGRYAHTFCELTLFRDRPTLETNAVLNETRRVGYDVRAHRAGVSGGSFAISLNLMSRVVAKRSVQKRYAQTKKKEDK